MDFYSQGREDRVCFFHDAFPIAHLIDPSLFGFTEGHMRVATDPLNKGQTALAPEGSTASPDWLNAQKVKVATQVNHPKLTELFVDTYAR